MPMFKKKRVQSDPDVELRERAPSSDSSQPELLLAGQVNGGEPSAIFGQVADGGTNYRTLGWMRASVVLTKVQIGLGVLAIPEVFHKLGLLAGIFCTLIIATMTTWAGYMIGKYKEKHPEVYSLDDFGFMVAGRFGKWLARISTVLYWTFVSGSAMRGIATALEYLTNHKVCDSYFLILAVGLGIIFASIPTVDRISWGAWAAMFFILSAIFTLTISVGLIEKPDGAPDGPWESDWVWIAHPSFADASSALSILVFAYSGIPACFTVHSEMRRPELFTKALFVSQSVVATVYLVVGIVVYIFCGSFVSTPALGSAGPVLGKVCYALALFGLFFTLCIVLHIPSKFVFVRRLQDTKHLTANTPTHWVTWICCTVTFGSAAYIIASVIPDFENLVAFIGAILGPPLAIIPMGGMWLYDNWKRARAGRDWKWKLMICWCVFIIVGGLFLMGAGSYGTITAMIEAHKKGGGSKPWACNKTWKCS